jgi:transposase
MEKQMEGKVKLQYRRNFTEEFKKARVSEYERGENTVKELSNLFGIKCAILYRWIYKYSLYNKKSYKIVEMKESSTLKVKDLTTRMRELERIVGEKQIKIDYLEKIIELAKDEYNIDLKKNLTTESSNIFGSTKSK